MKILLTGFEPFGGDRENPTEYIAMDFDDTEIMGHAVIGKVLPVSVKRTGVEIEKVLKDIRPDVVISMGLAPTYSNVAVERIAINLVDARIPDNDGEQPVDLPIEKNAPLAYMATLPVRAIVKAHREQGIPSLISYSAGTYLCNYTMFKVLHYSKVHGYPRRAGFLHLPYIPRQVVNKRFLLGKSTPSMCLELEKLAVEIAIRKTIKYEEKGLDDIHEVV